MRQQYQSNIKSNLRKNVHDRLVLTVLLILLLCSTFFVIGCQAWTSNDAHLHVFRKLQKKQCLSPFLLFADWSNCAEITITEQGAIDCRKKCSIRNTTATLVTTTTNNGKETTYDLSSPREWLEYWENVSGFLPGAYTVIRCEYRTNNNGKEEDSNTLVQKEWNIWGLPFHLQRLLDSFQIIFGKGLKRTEHNNNKQDKCFYDEPVEDTMTVLHALLVQAKKNIQMQQNQAFATARELSSSEKSLFAANSSSATWVVMVTILWQVTRNANDKKGNNSKKQLSCRVKGHVIPIGKQQPLQQPEATAGEIGNNDNTNNTNNNTKVNKFQPPQPIHVSVASPPPLDEWNETSRSTRSVSYSIVTDSSSRTVGDIVIHDNNHDNVVSSSSSPAFKLVPFPSRKGLNPQAKVSFWCRQRRALEQLYKYLPVLTNKNETVNIGEVLLIDHYDDNNTAPSILEGLTSNVFFVYPNNSIRTTANHGDNNYILEGYARQLVIDAADKLGYKMEYAAPITIQDQHLWKEVFTTSSIKLIVPVTKIFLPQYNYHPLDSVTHSGKGGNKDKNQNTMPKKIITATIRQWHEIWSDKPTTMSENDKSCSPNDGNNRMPIWQRLYNEIFHESHAMDADSHQQET